jgi:CRISPR/Cas system CSM-associated protein Csm3 (group 7 of RAMP superfamily)
LLIKILLKAKEPLSVGMESMGIRTLLYKLPVILKNGEIIEIPIIPGNTFRGMIRDTMSKKFILDICEQSANTGSSQINVDAGTALTMFSGGILKKRGQSSKTTIQELIGEYARYLLPLSILGFAFSNTIVPGKVKVGCGYPLTRETEEIVKDIYWEDTNLTIEDILTTVLLTRKNDIGKISQIHQIKLNEETIDNYLGEDTETGALQQRMEREAVIPGTQFVTFIRDVLPLRPEEKGLLWATLEEIKSIGGGIARGFGEVELSLIDGEGTEETKTAYTKFIKENRDNILVQLNKSPLKIE